MDTLATHYFSYALMTIVARRVAKLAQTDPVKASEHFDMHAEVLNEVERQEFSNAVADAAMAISMGKSA